MNNCGTGAEKSLSFRFHEIATLVLAMTKFFDCARNENLFGAYL